MENWITYSFDEIIEDISDGGTPSRSKQGYFDGSIPWVVIDDIHDYIYETKEKITEAGLKACSSKLWPKGTIILSTGATIGKVGIAQVKLATKQGICGIRVNESLINNVYFMYYLKYIKNQLNSYAQGSTIKEIRPNTIKGFSLSVPKSIEEQQLIGEILLKADDLITQTQIEINKFKKLKIGIMQDLLTKGIDKDGNIRSEETHKFKDSPLGRIPVNWENKSISDYSEKVTSGSRGWAKFYSQEGAKFIRIGNLKRNQIDIDLSDVKYVDLPNNSEGKRTALKEHDLLISITADLGIIGVVSKDFGEAYINQHIALVRLNQEEVNPRYVGYYLTSYYAQKMFTYNNDGSTKAGLNLGTISSLSFVKPCLEEQNKIVTLLDKYNLILSNKSIELKKLNKLKNGLMQDLFKGKLRVTDLIL